MHGTSIQRTRGKGFENTFGYPKGQRSEAAQTFTHSKAVKAMLENQPQTFGDLWPGCATNMNMSLGFAFEAQHSSTTLLPRFLSHFGSTAGPFWSFSKGHTTPGLRPAKLG
jgi:hypothetical protein